MAYSLKKTKNKFSQQCAMPLVLPLAVFEGEALLRHLRHRRRRHRVQEDSKIQYKSYLQFFEGMKHSLLPNIVI